VVNSDYRPLVSSKLTYSSLIYLIPAQCGE
jgi:hypothetical protein